MSACPFDRRPLIEAVEWLLLVGVFVALIVVGLVFDIAVYTLSGGMLAYGIFAVVRVMISLLGIQQEYQRCHRDWEALKERSLRAHIEELQEQNAKFSVLLDVLKAKELRNQRTARGVLESFGTELEAANARNIHAAGVLQVLGILGTMVGCTAVVYHLNLVLGVSESDDLGGALVETLRSMSLIFVTSAVGCLIGGLIVRGLASVVERAIARLIAQLYVQADIAHLEGDDDDDDE